MKNIYEINYGYIYSNKNKAYNDLEVSVIAKDFESARKKAEKMKKKDQFICDIRLRTIGVK